MTRYRVMVGFPGAPRYAETVQMLDPKNIGTEHDYRVEFSHRWPGNFNPLWCAGLNAERDGTATHFMQLHADVIPRYAGWGDRLMRELLAKDADVVSACIPERGPEGVLSCGVGNPVDRWDNSYRRLTVHEMLAHDADTFNLSDLWGGQYQGMPFLFNSGLFVADMRRPLWHETEPDGMLKIFWDFRWRAYQMQDGRYGFHWESEDWRFCYLAWLLGVRAYCTKAVHAQHMEGRFAFNNWSDWGTQQMDELTAERWAGT